MYQSTAALTSSTSALRAGYRHIDSARIYRNEAEVVAAVRGWKEGGGQGSVWLTSKVTGKEHGTVKTALAVEDSVGKAEGLSWVSCEVGRCEGS